MNEIYSEGELERMADEVFVKIEKANSDGLPLLTRSEISILYKPFTNDPMSIVESVLKMEKKYGEKLRRMGYNSD